MTRRKRKPHKPIPSSGKSMEARHRSTGLIIAVMLTLILGGIPFGLGKYIEFHSPDPFDSGAYVYSAQHLLQGARLGIEETPSAYPITLLANIIGVKLFGFSELGPKIIQMIFQLTALVFMFYSLRKLFGSIAAVAGTAVAAVYLSAPLIAKFGNVKEQYMIALSICAACSFLMHESTLKRYWLAVCGFFAVLPYYCKATGVSVMVAIAAYLLVSRCLGRQWKILWIDVLLLLGGIAVGLLIPASLFIWQKRLDMFLNTFPVIAFQVVIGLLGVAAALFYGILYIRKVHLWCRLRQVRRIIWLSGVAILLLALVVCVIAVVAANRYYTQQANYATVPAVKDVSGYISDIPMVSIPIKIYHVFESLLDRLFRAAGLKGGYVEYSWKAITFGKLAPQVFRYYKALCVPILLALASVLTGAFIWLSFFLRKTSRPGNIQSKIVWFLTLWWLVDMTLVWVSPHSYEQYYLPLCASAAVLSGYCIWVWSQKPASTQNKMPWLAGGLAAAVTLGCLTIPIFIGQCISPDTGNAYTNPQTRQPIRRRGFAEALERVKADTAYSWQSVGDYIRTHSSEADTLYVWGWMPGIYVRAQRMAPIPKAYEGDMHVTPPDYLAQEALQMVRAFEKNPPKYIVDTRKIHFPNDRPPLELWPHTYAQQKPYGQPISNRPQVIDQYDEQYKKLLAEQFDPRQKEYANLPAATCWLQYAPWTKTMPDEAARYEAVKPLRDFIMSHYTIVQQPFGPHVLFERK